MSARVAIRGLGSELPPAVSQQALWEGYFAGHFREARAARRVFASVGVTARHPAVNPLVEDISLWSTEQRMRRYRDEAVPLARGALRAALTDAAIAPEALGLLVVVSCTGYCTPGLDVLAAHDLGLDPSARRVMFGHMGCHAALPALATAADYVRAEQRAAAVVCVELASLHVQPPTADLGQVVCHALFGDAAAAAILDTAGSPQDKLVLCSHAAHAQLSAWAQLTWEITDRGFRMELSRDLPRLVGAHVAPFFEHLVGARPDAIEHVAIHPGGPEILAEVGRALSLSDARLSVSRTVLAEHGNCSSPTILLVLERALAGGEIRRGERVVALGFGPGISLEGALFEAAC